MSESRGSVEEAKSSEVRSGLGARLMLMGISSGSRVLFAIPISVIFFYLPGVTARLLRDLVGNLQTARF